MTDRRPPKVIEHDTPQPAMFTMPKAGRIGYNWLKKQPWLIEVQLDLKKPPILNKPPKKGAK